MKLIWLLSLTFLLFSAHLLKTVSAAGDITILSKTPAANTVDAAKDSEIVVQFSANIDSTTISKSTFNVDGSLSGEVAGTYATVTDTITFTPTADFEYGETVVVTLTTGIEDSGGETLATAVTWQFVAEVPLGVGTFHPVPGKTLDPAANNWHMALGDLDGDGDLDGLF